MRASWLDLVRWLRLPLAPTAACDALACRLLAEGAAPAGALAPLPLLALAQLALTSVLVYAVGMGLNDWADRERDRTLAPERPLASGRLSSGRALVLLLALAAAAVGLGGGPGGDRGLVVLALALAALYDLGLKHALVPGAAAMGGVRAVNAALAVLPPVLAGHAPAWVLGAPLGIGLYSAGITVLSTTEETPSLARPVVARGLAALAYALAGTLAVLAAGRVTLGSALAAGTLLSLAFGRVPRAGPVKRQVLEMLLGLYLLAAVVAGGSGQIALEAAAFGVAFLLVYATQAFIRALRRT